MKSADVIIGATYQTKICGALRVVVVTGTRSVRVGSWNDQKYQTAFVVTDKVTGRVLPKPRKAVSLRMTKGAAFALALPEIVKGLAKLAA